MPSVTTQNIASVASRASPSPSALTGQRTDPQIVSRTEVAAANEAAVKRATVAPPRSDKERGTPVNRQVAGGYSPQTLKERAATKEREEVGEQSTPPEPSPEQREGQSLDVVA